MTQRSTVAAALPVCSDDDDNGGGGGQVTDQSKVLGGDRVVGVRWILEARDGRGSMHPHDRHLVPQAEQHGLDCVERQGVIQRSRRRLGEV